jgi:regulatory protein
VIITALVRKPRRKLIDVHIDGELRAVIGADLAIERDLRAGREISAGDLARLEYEQARRSCLQAAVRLLSYRQRSERELRQRLRQKGFAKPPIDEAVVRLRQLGYVNDAAFARFYAEAQQAARPRSQRLLTVELRQKGVEAGVAEQATLEVDDEAAALEAARRRLPALRDLDYQRFRERLGSFLTRRGFSYDVARTVIARCWEEQRTAGENGASA